MVGASLRELLSGLGSRGTDMDTNNVDASSLDRVEAARQLAEADARSSVASDHDRRVYAIFTASIALAMGIGVILMILSPWMMIAYVLVLAGLTWWQWGARGASPRGAGLTYVVGVVGSGVMVGVVVAVLANFQESGSLVPWMYVLGALVVALPGLIAAAFILLRGTSR